MSSSNGSKDNGYNDSSTGTNPQYYGSFALTAPILLLPQESSNIAALQSSQASFGNGQLQPIASTSQLLQSPMDLQSIHSSLQGQQVPMQFQRKIVTPVPVKPTKGKSAGKRKAKAPPAPTQPGQPRIKQPKLPPQLTSANFPSIPSNVAADCNRTSRKRPKTTVIETKDKCCQTSGWKFMSEIGTIEAMKKKNSRDKSVPKTNVIGLLRSVCKRFRQKIDSSVDSPVSHRDLMDSIMEDLARWFSQQNVENSTKCILCGKTFKSVKAVGAHFLTSCSVFRTVFEETIVGVTPLSSPDVEQAGDEPRDKSVESKTIQSLFSKCYLHENSYEGLKRICTFCGEKVNDKQVSEDDMYLDKRHLFDSCIVFRSFLMFHNQPYILTISQKVGTCWTFLYYNCLLNYFALQFKYQINDLRFIQEDKSDLIIQMMESITDIVITRTAECPLCFSVINNPYVLKHHIAFSMCPFLLKFFRDMKAHVDQVWERVSGHADALRKISCCFQYFMGFQETAKPIMIKQSILEESLAVKLLENAMYFKSLDTNFSLQFYKTPKEAGVAMEIEKLQQEWAEEVLKVKETNLSVDLECPFCLTTFNNDRNRIKHIVYISCKSIRPVCNQIYSLIEFCEWDVLNPVAIVTQHCCYIIKQTILRGEIEINLSKEQLTEYITNVTGKFLNFNLTEKVRRALFESTEESAAEPDLSPEELEIFQDFFLWAKRIIKKKNGAMCPLCGQDKAFFNTLVNHLAFGACPYLKQFLQLMDEIYKYNHLFKPCQAPAKIAVSKNRKITFDFVHHIRKVLFLFKGSTKSKTFFNHSEFEAFLVGSPQNYTKHMTLMTMLSNEANNSCLFCFMDLKSHDSLLSHLLYFQCPTIMFVIDLVKNEWDKCINSGMYKTEKMLDIIKIYSSMFELDPCTVISSNSMKKYFVENNNTAMLKNFKYLQSWAQDMYTLDSRSSLNICNACNIAAENIECHLWLEEPMENFCPQIKSYLDFHRKMVCKKDNRGEIRASFTVTDLFELKRFVQGQFSYVLNGSSSGVRKQSIISPCLRRSMTCSIAMTLKIYPRFEGTLESFRLMYGTSGRFLTNQMAIANKIAVSETCFLCNTTFQTVDDVRYHVATFECQFLQGMLQTVRSQDQVDEEVVKGELFNGYKRTVAYCRDLYPNLYEGNLLLVMETVNSQCHSKLYNFIMSKFTRSNPYKCLFCSEVFESMGEIYTHYKNIQCLGLRKCFGLVPNKGPGALEHPFLHSVHRVFQQCYTHQGTKSLSKLKHILQDVNNLADCFEFWCFNFCNSLVPECLFCGSSLMSVSVIKAHPMTCGKLKEINLEVFRSDRLTDISFMKQQALGSCKLTGKLPKEVVKESEGVSFMQRYRCSVYLGWIPLCLDCAASHGDPADPSTVDEETCRFLWFRRLVKKESRLVVCDFESSRAVARISSWIPQSGSEDRGMDLGVEAAKYILRHLLPHFNNLMNFELWQLENTSNIRLKHQVKNVRELCDSCMTTLFNVHLFCPRCGYVICMDCYRDRLAGKFSMGLADCTDGSVHNITSLETCVTIPLRAIRQLCSGVESVKDLHCISVIDLPFTKCPTSEAPHEIICNGQVLALKTDEHHDVTRLFSKFHQKGNAVVVHGLLSKINTELWSPESFSKQFGQERELVINTSTLEVHRISLKDFFDGFENVNERPRNENGDPMVLKLKDWPTTWDFKEKLPAWYEDFMKVLPLKDYSQRDGKFNIARYLPDIYCSPDLGPKMYIAYSNANNPDEGSTVLHIDISDAVNVVMYVGQTQDVFVQLDNQADSSSTASSSFLKRKVYTLEEICEDTDEKQLERIRRDRCKIGALWHIFHPNDIDKIRHFIHKVHNENGQTLPPGHDPIHDQTMYIDRNMRKRLLQEYGVQGWAIVQCEGDAVFIPAGAPHQVRNLQNCIKIAEDYVSPERISFCLKHTQEIRHLSKTHSNQEDKLQIKNLIYHGVKECVGVLQNNLPTKDLCTCKPNETRTFGTQMELDQRNLINNLEIENEMLRKNSSAEKETLNAMIKTLQDDYNKARKCYDLEKRDNKELKIKLTKWKKYSESQKAQGYVKFPVPYKPSDSSSSSSSRSQQSYQKQEDRSTELRKPEPRHPRHRSSEPAPSSSRAHDHHPRAPQMLSSSSNNFGESLRPSAVSSNPSTSRDPRLKQKVTSQRRPPESSTFDFRPYEPTPGPIHKSAFQGVPHAVQNLRKKQPPPQKIRRTPETPEPMDTNQDSCSPRPASYGEAAKSNLEMLSVVSANQPRNYHQGVKQLYDQGNSNSETDSNEDLLNSQYGGNFAPTPPASKPAIIPGPFSSPSVSPGFNPKSLNLQISSPKQPAIFSNQGPKKGLFQGEPSRGKNPPSTLADLFPLGPGYSNYSSAKQSVTIKKTIKTELRTPPSERQVNIPPFAPHLASFLPDYMTKPAPSSWNTSKTVSSPVTPTMATPAAVSSPATPPSQILSNVTYSTPPNNSEAIRNPQQNLINNPNQNLMGLLPTSSLRRLPPPDKDVPQNTARSRVKSNESYASLSSSSPDVGGNKPPDPGTSRDPRLTRKASGEGGSRTTEVLKPQDQTVTSSNETTDSRGDQPSPSEAAPETNVSSTTSGGPSGGPSKEQMYCLPETEKLVIFDDALISRLKKKPVSESVVEEPERPEESAPSSHVNPLLRRSFQRPTSPTKTVKKPNLTETVDAILKSDKLQPAVETAVEPVVEPVVPTVLRFEDMVSPVLAALSSINRSGEAKRSREPSGNSVSSLAAGLSPISAASTPPVTESGDKLSFSEQSSRKRKCSRTTRQSGDPLTPAVPELMTPEPPDTPTKCDREDDQKVRLSVSTRHRNYRAKEEQPSPHKRRSGSRDQRSESRDHPSGSRDQRSESRDHPSGSRDRERRRKKKSSGESHRSSSHSQDSQTSRGRDVTPGSRDRARSGSGPEHRASSDHYRGGRGRDPQARRSDPESSSRRGRDPEPTRRSKRNSRESSRKSEAQIREYSTRSETTRRSEIRESEPRTERGPRDQSRNREQSPHRHSERRRSGSGDQIRSPVYTRSDTRRKSQRRK